MELPLLLDEHIDPLLADKLDKAGHSVDQVHEVSGLGAGASDTAIRRYAVENDQIIVTNDDDFLVLPPDSHSGVFYLPDQSLSAHKLYRIIQHVTESYPSRSELRPVIYLTDDWL